VVSVGRKRLSDARRNLGNLLEAMSCNHSANTAR
jgi:hypothetical protein